MKYAFEDGLDYARKMDETDALAGFRDRFYLNDGEIYMDGNSLGLCSRDAEETLMRVLGEWKTMGINCWTKPELQLFLYQDHLGALCAPLVNADPDEVTIHANTTLNIHSAIGTFYEPTETRYKILVDDINFPTDRHAVDGQLRLKGLDPDTHVKVIRSRDGKHIFEDDMIEAMTDDVALMLLPSVLYRSGQLVNMKRLTAEAHKRGIIVGWDLCHSIGAVPHDFKEVDPDFAIWCNYKYLNGGPGASAGLYINRRHFHKPSGLPGWHGNVKETQFELSHKFEKAKNAGGWQSGTQSILSMAPLEGSLKMYAEAGVENLRRKSLALTAYMRYLVESKLSRYGFTVGTPTDDAIRGGHLALEHDEALRINEAMKAAKIIPDFRFPNVIRLAPAPLYIRFEDVYDMVERMVAIMEERAYEQYDNKVNTVA